MERLISLILNPRLGRLFCLAVLLVAGMMTLLAKEAQHDDDVLAFLPIGDPDVALFRELGSRFGGLDVALVGIDAGEDLFGAEFLARLARATEALGDLEQVNSALSLSNIERFQPDPELGGIQVSPLIQTLPSSRTQAQALRAQVMANDSAVGSVVSADGEAVLVYAFLVPGADPRVAAEQIRVVIDHELSAYPRYWGGVPFISTWIYDSTDRDMERLLPWALLAIIAVLMVTFRDPRGVVLSLVTTGMGVVSAQGAMTLAGVSINIVLSSMPIILFAVGSAYSIHILSHYYAHRERLSCDEALAVTLRSIGPVVLAAGLTTVAGLLSFVTMDIEPMRSFGMFTALGIFTTLILSLSFVPVVIRLTDLRRAPRSSRWLESFMTSLMAWILKHRALSGGTLLLILLLAAGLAGRVQARMDNTAFFEQGSPPALSEGFLKDRFGGSQFLQLHLRGDLKSPFVLRELRRLADRIELLEGVSATLHIGQVVAVVNEAMEGARRIPDSAQKVALLYELLQGNEAIRQLISDGRDEALLQIRLSASTGEQIGSLLGQVELLLEASPGAEGGPLRDYRLVFRADEEPEVAGRLQRLLEARVSILLQRHGLPLDVGLSSRLSAILEGQRRSASATKVEELLLAFLQSEECIAEIPQERSALPAQVALFVTKLGPNPSAESLRRAITAAVLGGLEQQLEAIEAQEQLLIEDLEFSLDSVLAEVWSQESAAATAAWLLSGVEQNGRKQFEIADLERKLAAALLDLESPAAMAVASPDNRSGSLSWTLSGQPVLHRALSRSVTANQGRSLASALLLVLLLLCWFFRSLVAGLLACAPTVVTIAVVFGAMGALGLHLDIGTSMLSSLIIGAGVDYGVHLLASWRREPGEAPLQAAGRAAAASSEAIWTNALMVAAGFFVLTLGEARPLQNVGSLTAAAMLCAALATFWVIPLLALRDRYTVG
ncbi:MAG: hypothetical protein CMP23_09160 [Rickettsiales bacterium]|nr:hypothetical protein [Rickettsiales bacterium]